MNNTDVESIIEKIDKEISDVKSHVGIAKESLRNDDYNEAISHLRKAESISTCSYCKQKLNYFIANVNYSDTLCDINYKTCGESKQNTMQEMQQFIDKLPSISDIRKNKASFNGEDPFALVWKSLGDMNAAFWKLIGWG